MRHRVVTTALLAVLFGWIVILSATPLRRDPQPSPVDLGFVQSMSRHHQQAVAMALRMLDGQPTVMAGFAQGIVLVQQFELGTLRGWLQLWARPVQTGSDMTWMLLGQTPPDDALRQYLLDCRRASTGMAGLASEADLARLRQLQGRERDRWFLQLMLAHHRGALPMARFAAREASVPAVRELALRIELDQTAEVGRLLQMQQVLSVTPDPPRLR